MKDRLRHRLLTFVLLAMAATLPDLAAAAAGKLLFVAGPVTRERQGAISAAQLGDVLESGDVVATGAKARAQILMGDGARFALRAGTRFKIDEFRLPSNVQKPGVAQAVEDSGRSVTSLIQGGFRTRSGTVGKSDRSAYEVRTPVGTLGIRGTEYVAVFCRNDCSDAPGLAPGQPIRAGLYLLVSEGRIVFTGRGITLTLDAPNAAFIPLEEAGPEELRDVPAFLREDGFGVLKLVGRVSGAAGARDAIGSDPVALLSDRRAPQDSKNQFVADAPLVKSDRPVDANSPFGTTVDLTSGVRPSDPQRDIALSVPPAAFLAKAAATAFRFNTSGALIEFPAMFGTGSSAAAAVYRLGSATVVEAGSPALSGISWGRWSGGAATATIASGSSMIDLSGRSLHYLVGPSYDAPPLLPISGNATYVLAGGTSPTDTLGRSGTLGAAFLAADFTNRNLTTTLDATINGINWWATGTAPLTAGSNLFAAPFAAVRANSFVPGAGQFSGFFVSGNSGGAPTAVGLSYLLTDSLGQLGTINGVAALAPGAGQPPAQPFGRRNLAYAAPPPANGATYNQVASDTETQATFSSNNSLNGFVGPSSSGSAASGTFAIGTASVVNGGSDAATGLRWGRWSGGNASVNTGQGAQSINLANDSLHFVTGSLFGPAPVLPSSGTVTYVLVGATTPTGTNNLSGTLGNVFLSADFTNRTVTQALTLDWNALNVYATGMAALATGANTFAGTYGTVLIDGQVPGNGSFSGFFSQPGYGGATTPGAGVSYTIVDPANNAFRVEGVLALTPGANTPPAAPGAPRRNLSYGISNLLRQPGPYTAATLTTVGASVAVDASGNVVRFVAPYKSEGEGLTTATFLLGTANNVNTGFDTATGIRWGRWSGGTASVTTGGGDVPNQDLTAQSLHWILAPQFGNTAPLLPTSGSASFTLAGGTNPTDDLGNVGTLGAAGLNADFTNNLVTAAVDLSIDGRRWYGTGGGRFAQGSFTFDGALNGELHGLTQTDGAFSGFFTVPTYGGPSNSGAAFNYTLGAVTGDVGAVAGAAALVSSGSALLPPAPAREARDVSFAVLDVSRNPQLPFVGRNVVSGYTVDGNFDLVRFTGDYRQSAQTLTGEFAIGTGTQNDQGASAFAMLRWGRWADNTAQVTPASGAPFDLVLSGNNLHWIVSADANKPAVMPSSGTASYSLLGATQPSDNSGRLGLVGSATLNADFTNLSVATTLNVAVAGAYTFSMQGTGVIGAQAGLPSHQFSGSFNNLTSTYSDQFGSLPASGAFTGFFSGPTSAAQPAPPGVGLTFLLTELQNNVLLNGAVALRRN